MSIRHEGEGGTDKRMVCDHCGYVGELLLESEDAQTWAKEKRWVLIPGVGDFCHCRCALAAGEKVKRSKDSPAHTPGPWNVIEAPLFGWWVKRGESFIAPIPRHHEFDGRPCGDIAGQDKTDEECEANAHLIAAAPELLMALRQCLVFVDKVRRLSGGDGDIAAMNARVALAKAEGRE